ncbi:hypothetical protein NQZ68_029299 [Dissostichus eleginoides]|nr:hypothetical protein NQZ68_029299 [Dissostichus eleginoides]
MSQIYQRALTCSSAHLTAKPSNRSQHVLQPAHHAQHDSLPPHTLHIVQSFTGRWITYTTLKHSTLKAGFKEHFKLRGVAAWPFRDYVGNRRAKPSS